MDETIKIWGTILGLDLVLGFWFLHLCERRDLVCNPKAFESVYNCILYEVL